MTLDPWFRSRSSSSQIEFEKEERVWSFRPSCLGSMLKQLSLKARILFLCENLEEPSINLIFLVRMSRDLDNYDAWLGIKLGSEQAMVRMDQLHRGSCTRASYRQDQPAPRLYCRLRSRSTYEAVVRAFFLIQKTEQIYANSLSKKRFPRLEGPGRDNTTQLSRSIWDCWIQRDAEINIECSDDESEEAE